MGVHGKTLRDFYYSQFGNEETFFQYAPKAKSEDWVYLVFCYKTKLCKIGISGQLKSRLMQINCSVGAPCDLVVAVQLMPEYDENPEFIEKSIHKYFKNKRTIGEWFDLQIKDVIQIYWLFYEIEGDDFIDRFREVLKEYKAKL